MNVDRELVREIVRQVVAEVEGSSATETWGQQDGIFPEMDDAVEATRKAQRKLLGYSMLSRGELVQAMRQAARDSAGVFAHLAVEETGMGRVEDKIRKNLLVVDKTPGTEDLQAEAFTGDNGLTLVEHSPFGVIGSLTPSTNPTETIVCNALGMVAAGNGVVFSPHPSARQSSLQAVGVLNRAIVEAGGPKNLVTSVQEPSFQRAQRLMHHPDIDMLVATGGPGVVRAVLGSGKKAIGAGAGNPPVVVDETADVEKAARGIVDGASLDNNIPCICEKEIIVVECVADYLLFQLQQHGAVFLEDQDTISRLVDMLVVDGKPNPRFMGKDVQVILNQVGIQADLQTRLVVFEAGCNHPMVQLEMMMPVIPLVRVPDFASALRVAVEVEHGNRHTAVIHSQNVEHMTAFARVSRTTIFVKNGPSYAGIGVGGEGYTSFTIAGPTGEGLTSARHYTRKRRCVLVDGFSIG